MSDEPKKRRRPAKKSPTQRSLAYLRSAGYEAQVVERWNAFARLRQDLFGFIDVVAIRPAAILAVQATASAVADRIAKIKAEPKAVAWLAAGGSIEVHGWTLRGKAGRRKTYQLRRVLLELRDEGIEAREVEQAQAAGGER